VILALVLLFSLRSPFPGGEGGQEEAKITQEVEYANSREKPQLHVSASRRLKERGGPAVASAILDYVSKHGRNALSIVGTETLGALKDPRIVALLRELLADPEFTWRPAAARALAEHADPSSLEAFRAGLGDKLWGVRAASVLGLERLNDRASAARLKELLGDEIYDVRAQAAKSLHAFGDLAGLPVLVEALRSDTVWFEIDYGQIAREDAWNFLKRLTKDDFGYKPWESAEARAPGLARFEAWIAKTIPDWRERVPAKARARAEQADYVFGYELRSCQRGDFFLRIDAQDNLVLGYFNLEKAKLAAAEKRELEAALEGVKAVDRSTAYGEGGCDFEQFYVKDGARFDKLWIGQRGRPGKVEPFLAVAQRLVRKHFGPQAADDFRHSSLIFRAEE
jgi:hypothetical protein